MSFNDAFIHSHWKPVCGLRIGNCRCAALDQPLRPVALTILAGFLYNSFAFPAPISDIRDYGGFTSLLRCAVIEPFQATVLDRFGDVVGGDVWGIGEVANGAGDARDAIESARGKLSFRTCMRE